jgi:hypothetical protein
MTQSLLLAIQKFNGLFGFKSHSIEDFPSQSLLLGDFIKVSAAKSNYQHHQRHSTLSSRPILFFNNIQ